MKKIISIAILSLVALDISAQNLYVGVNFHPHDYESMTEIDGQIALIRIWARTVRTKATA